jgi:thiamine biosynthesis lipoprotein
MVEAPASVSRSRFLMGAPLAIEARGPGAEQAIEAAFDEVARLDQVLSGWHDSELQRLNARAALGPVPCSEDLFHAVAEALRWAAATGGAFDPTVEPAVRGLGLRGEEGRLPAIGTLGLRPAVTGDGVEPGKAGGQDAPRPPVGWHRVRADAETRTVAFGAAGMGIDLGGIGKGIALDAAARVLRARGVASALLDFGGQLLAFGPGPDDGGWLVGLADPRDREHTAAVLTLRDASLATSGQGERGRPAAAGRIGHILDPASGAPAPFAGTVSVLSADATSADALSTALFVMGPERGLRWAESHGRDVLFEFPDASGRLVRRGTGLLDAVIAADRGPTPRTVP